MVVSGWVLNAFRDAHGGCFVAFGREVLSVVGNASLSGLRRSCESSGERYAADFTADNKRSQRRMLPIYSIKIYFPRNPKYNLDVLKSPNFVRSSAAQA